MAGTSPDAQQLAASYADTLIHFPRPATPTTPAFPAGLIHRPTML